MISLFKVLMAGDAHDRVTQVLSSGHIAQGPVVDKFEAALADTLGVETTNVVTVNSGTSAIHLALVLAGVRMGDSVAVTPMTCAATIAPILHLGARPYWIDVDPVTGLMDPASLHWRLRSDTRAIIAVDWAGVPCDYDAIHEAANGIPVIQDAAHAFLARDGKGRQIARAVLNEYTFGESHFIAHSFQAIKHLTTGDGGALIVPRIAADQARRLRWFGFDRTSGKDFRCAQDLTVAGYKFHMNDIAAAIGLANLRVAESAVECHRANAGRYFDELGNLGPRVRVPPAQDGASWWIYTLLVDDRAKFQAFMAERGIETSQVHRRNDEHTVFRQASRAISRVGARELPGLDEFSQHQVSIPVGWWLSPSNIDQIIEAVRAYVKS